MSNNFTEIVRGKDREELIRIVIHNEEYKDELVLAAQEELKLRESIHDPNPQKSHLKSVGLYNDMQFNSLTQTSKLESEKPLSIFLSGILQILVGLICLYYVIDQSFLVDFFNSNQLRRISAVNGVLGIFSIAIGLGILTLQRWSFDWALILSIINGVWFGYLYSEYSFTILLFLSIAELFILLATYSSRSFLKQKRNSNIDLNLINPETSQTVNGEYKRILVELNNLIDREKGSVFGSQKTSIISFLNQLSSDKKNAENLLVVYRQIFGKDLIEELKSLSSSYDSIVDYCQPFIVNNLVGSKYPHDRLN